MLCSIPPSIQRPHLSHTQPRQGLFNPEEAREPPLDTQFLNLNGASISLYLSPKPTIPTGQRIALTLMCRGRKRIQIAAPGKGRGGLGSAPYCPIIRIDFQDQYCHKETGEDKDCGGQGGKEEGGNEGVGEKAGKGEEIRKKGGQKVKLQEGQYRLRRGFLVVVVSQEAKGRGGSV